MYEGFWLWEAQSIVFDVSGRPWEVQSVVFYVSGRLWEAQSIVFYVSPRLWEVHSGVFYEVLRLLGGPASNGAKSAGGSAEESTLPYASFTRAG